MELISIKDSRNYEFLITSWDDWYLKKGPSGKWHIIHIDVEMRHVFYLHPNAKLETYSYFFDTIDEAMKSLQCLAVLNKVKNSFGQFNVFVKLQSSFWRTNDE